MNYYLVDYENVRHTGLNGVSKLSENDVVCIFYTEAADTLPFGLHRRLKESVATILYKKVKNGTKNALDFQLSSYLGYIIRENEESPYNYFIVTKDNGFNCLVNFWGNKANIKLVENVATDNKHPELTGLEHDVYMYINGISDSVEDFVKIAKMIRKYKTKSGINNALMREFKSNNNQKASQIYAAIKPLIADKKGR